MNQYEESRARSSAAYLAALGRLSTTIMSERDVLHLLASSACELTGADFAAFIARPVDEPGKRSSPSVTPQVQIAAAVGLSLELEALLRRLLLETEGPLAPLFRSGLPVRVSDTFAPLLGTEQPVSSDEQGTSEKAAVVDQVLMRSCLGAPLLDLSGSVHGEVLLGHREAGYFRQEDEAFLMSLTALAALPLARARFSEQTQVRQGADQWTDQRSDETQRELLAQTDQIRALCETMTDAMLILDRSANIVQTNTAARKLFAFDVVSDYVRRPWEKRASLFVLLDLQGQPLAREHWPVVRLLRGEALAGEKEVDMLIRILDGRQIQVSITGTPVHDQEGRLLGVVMIIRDLSARYHLEQSLQEAEQQAWERASQLETLFAALPEALMVFDREGKITRMNAAAQQLFERIRLSNYATAPFADRSARVAVWDEQGQTLDQESFPTARVLAGEALTPPEAVEVTIGGEQGQAVSLSITGSPLRDAQKRIVGAVMISRDVTDHKRTEQALQEQALRLQMQSSLIDLAHDAILVRDAQGHIVSWNQGAERLYGWIAREVVGHITHMLLQTGFPISREEVNRLLERDGQWEGTLVHTTRDGRHVTVESRQVLVRDAAGSPSAILEINRDITERQRLQQFEKRLHAETDARRALLQLILDELPSSIYLVHGHDARLILANRASTTLWGANWSAGQPMQQFLQENGICLLDAGGKMLASEQQTTMQVLRTGKAISEQQEVIRQPDGTFLPVLVNAVDIDLSQLLPIPGPRSQPVAQEREPAALVIHQDVTALKEAEHLKDDFIAIAAHELRNALAALKGPTQTLLVQDQRRRGPQLAQWQREVLDEIDTAIVRLVDLTEDLLDVTRLQAGRLELYLEPTNLIALVRRIVKRVQRTTTQHDISLHTSLEELVLLFDPDRIEQVLSNLLENAIKYSPQRGSIEVTIWQESQEVILSVRDRGLGIPLQEQSHIFERFVRASNVRKIVGTGLGLYICRALVELHSGRLWFSSVEGQGTTFFLTLPGGEAVPQ